MAKNWNGETPFDEEHGASNIDILIENIAEGRTLFWRFIQNYIFRLLNRSI